MIVNEREWKFLSNATGLSLPFNDMYFRYLRGLGYEGTLQDMIAASGLGTTPSDNWIVDGSSFTFDFVANRYYLHSPSLSRSSTAMFNRNSKDWIEYPPNVLRRDSRGALLEPGRTNAVANNAMAGAVIGVLGDGGQLPTGWSMNAATPGLTVEVVAIGEHHGLPTIDIRYSGMSSGANPEIFVMPVPGTPATISDDISISAFVQVVGGSMAGISNFQGIRTFGFNDAGGFISGTSSNFTAPIAVTGEFKRYSKSARLLVETVERTRMAVLGSTMSDPSDVTFRVAAPQLEFGTFPTSPIVTDGTSETRAADILAVSGLTGTHDLTLYLDDETEIQVPGWDTADPIPLTGVNGRMISRIVGMPE